MVYFLGTKFVEKGDVQDKTMTKKLSMFFALLIALLAASAPIAASAAALQLYSETAILIDGDTGQVLFEQNMHRQMHPASITKVMTALVALEHGDMDDVITMSYDAVFSIGRRTSHIALVPDEELTLANAMYANALSSANDASNGIAEHIGGTKEAFAAMMNQRAREAGALNTNFTNAHGLHEAGHLTTAYDMARIMMEAIRIPRFTEMFSTQQHDIPPTNRQAQVRHLWTTNTMVSGRYAFEGFVAGKTGYTTPAGHTLVTAARRDGRTLIAVVMRSESRRESRVDTEQLLNHGFDAFTQISFAPEELEQADFPLGGETAALFSDSGIRLLIPNDYTQEDVEIRYVYEHGAVRAVFTLNETVLGELEMQTDLISPEHSSLNDPSIENPEESRSTWWIWLIGIVGALLLGWGLLEAGYQVLKWRRRSRHAT